LNCRFAEISAAIDLAIRLGNCFGNRGSDETGSKDRLPCGNLRTCALAAHAEAHASLEAVHLRGILKGTTHGVASAAMAASNLPSNSRNSPDADAFLSLVRQTRRKGTPYASGGSPARVIRLDSEESRPPFSVPPIFRAEHRIRFERTLFVALRPTASLQVARTASTASL